MGKSKKTRWRTFSFDGSKDETQINDDVRVNGSADLSLSVNSQKYSQILGDHQTNYLPHNKNNTSAATAVHHNFKTRSYNKENYYNQRSVVKNNLASRNSWQRSNSGAFRATASSLKDNNNCKSEENGKSGYSESEKQDNSHITAEPIKFNEDEYTRITTPRQDVLFKKGYLSRMNSNKTANNLSATVDSTGPNSIATTATNSDPESSLSVSTLSPATTPSMDYGQMDSQDFTAAAPVYYPSYYDESGMLVIPMYNGYNYYPPNGSTSPVYLMPYPYQYDPFFMAPTPNTEASANDNTDEQEEQSQQNDDTVDGDGNEKVESDDVKENNQIAEGEQNNNNDDNDVHDGDGDDDEKDVKQEQSDVTSTNELNEQTSKQCFPIYANELGYVFPYANGFYNGFYYYNGMPSLSRPPKGKRRKRYSSSRSSHSHPPPPRSTAETTTDYSDDDGGNSTHNSRRYYSRYSHNNHHHNGWNHHHHHHHYSHQYHYNSSKYYYKNHFEHQNVNQAPTTAVASVEEKELAHHESNLNADVGEFYPRVHLSNNSKPLLSNQQQQYTIQKEPELERDATPSATTNDLEKPQQQSAQSKTKSDAPVKSINSNNSSSNTKPSHTSKSMGRISKKEIMDGIKLMEQQNINLKATSKTQSKTTSSSMDADVEWNVIKKGKKVKIVKDPQEPSVVETTKAMKDSTASSADEIKPAEIVTTALLSQEPVSNKKTFTTAMQTSVTNNSTTNNNSYSNNYNNVAKTKKPKSKGKKKKPFSMSKQDGFEIIEPDFTSNNDKESEEITNDVSEEDDEMTVVEREQEEQIIIYDNNVNECEQKQISNEPDHDKENVIEIVENEKKVEEVQEELLSDEIKVQEKILKIFNNELSQKSKVNDDNDAVIDISDEEICRKTSIEIDLSIAQEIAKIGTKLTKKEKREMEEKFVEENPVAIEMQASEKEEEQIFEDSGYFNDRKNIAELERDLVENLKILDDGIDIKSPVINPLYDFPITSAVRKWLQEKQNESFENLFRLENFKKLSELYDDCDDDEDDDESDISDSLQKSETTDSDYASDIQVKLNGSPASSNAKLDTKPTSKCNNKLIVKESFCALM